MQLYQENTTTTASLTREHWDVPIRVRLLPFVEFSRNLDTRLDDLVGRFGKKEPFHSARPLSSAGQSG